MPTFWFRIATIVTIITTAVVFKGVIIVTAIIKGSAVKFKLIVAGGCLKNFLTLVVVALIMIIVVNFEVATNFAMTVDSFT